MYFKNPWCKYTSYKFWLFSIVCDLIGNTLCFGFQSKRKEFPGKYLKVTMFTNIKNKKNKMSLGKKNTYDIVFKIHSKIGEQIRCFFKETKWGGNTLAHLWEEVSQRLNLSEFY